MSYRPRTMIGACPHCGSTAIEPQFSGFLGRRVRLACKCGVSGAWQDYRSGDGWHDAVRGWPFEADLGTPPPPGR